MVTLISNNQLIIINNSGSLWVYKLWVLSFVSLQLGVADETFWEDLWPLEFGEVPALEEDVVCVGFPTGGDNISVTRGVVSRVEIQRYAHSAVELLAIQVALLFLQTLDC